MERHAAHRKQPADSARLVAAKPTARSRITNGKQLHAGADGRTREARRWRDLYRHYMVATGGRCEQLCRSLASLIVERERLDAACARGEPVDALLLVRLSGEIRRLLTRLGLDEPEPYDGTQDAIRALRAGPDEARPA